jgi:hypothetical protein
VKSTDVPDYLRWLSQHKHYSSFRTELPVASLFFTQGNLNKSKIKHFMTDKRDNLRKPVIVSGDHYVIDGHHRVTALLNMDPTDTIPVIMVHAKVLDLITATREYPRSFTKNVVESFALVTEAAEKHTVLTFGRFNPPTAGHKKLVDKVHEVAKEHTADHHVVLSHTHDAEKNPLSPADKLKHAKRAFPGTHVYASSTKYPTIFHHAAHFHKAGTKHLHVVVGSDRVKEFHDSLHKYNGHFDKEGHGYKFKSITVHSAGHRDPDAKGVEGMSASKMREHAHSGNFKEFSRGVSSHMTPEHAKELYHDVRKGQGHLKESWYNTKVGHVEFKKADPKCKHCGGTGYTDNYNAHGSPAAPGFGTHNSSACSCTSKWVEAKLKEEVVEILAEGVHDAGIFKAVFITGGTGSGKDFVMKKSLHGHGLTEINSDTALEHLMHKGGLDKKMPAHEKEKRDVTRERAKSITDLRQQLAIHGRNGLIINSTGAKADQIKKLKGALEDLGYDAKMVFVDASDNVSRNRNVERGQRGGRMIPEDLRAKKWREAQDSRVVFSKMFGQEHYHEFQNDEDLRHNTDPEIHSQKTAELDDLFKTVRKFTQQPPKHPVAQEWVHRNLGKLAKQPIGNRAQQKAMTPPSSDSQASEEARKLGLTYYGYGKFGKNSRVSHFSLHGKLVEKQKALKPPASLKANTAKTQTTKKPLNEAFEELITEVTHGNVPDLQTPNALEDLVLVPGSEVLDGEFEHLIESSDTDGIRDLRDCYTETQEIPQEKVTFDTLRRRLVVSSGQGAEERTKTLSEGEATLEPGTESGAILGTGTNEVIDKTNGGLATSGPKKTLRKFRTDIK